MIERTFKDVENAIKATGAIYKEELEDGTSIFTSNPLSEEEKQEYHKQAKKNLQIMVDNLTKDINNHICKEIMKNFTKK